MRFRAAWRLFLENLGGRILVRCRCCRRPFTNAMLYAVHEKECLQKQQEILDGLWAQRNER